MLVVTKLECLQKTFVCAHLWILSYRSARRVAASLPAVLLILSSPFPPLLCLPLLLHHRSIYLNADCVRTQYFIHVILFNSQQPPYDHTHLKM